MKKRLWLLFLLSFSCLTVLMVGCGNQDMPKESDSGANWNFNDVDVWNFSPATFFDSHEDYDIEISLDQTVFEKAPEYLPYRITNKTGKLYEACGFFLEQKYDHAFFPHHEETASAWVRIPFFNGGQWHLSTESESSGKIIVDKFKLKDFEFTPGQYRLVMFAADGPHYAYFEITG